MLRLELEGVAVRYPDLAAPALDLPRLEVAPGESLAVTGPSGAGKSTFINVVTGLERRPPAPSGGTARTSPAFPRRGATGGGRGTSGSSCRTFTSFPA